MFECVCVFSFVFSILFCWPTFCVFDRVSLGGLNGDGKKEKKKHKEVK